MTVSVVIPTIGRDTLPSAVDSVYRQSDRPNEIIIVNDSPEQIGLAASLSTSVVEVFTGGAKGESYARNLGVQTASGDLIAYLDDDDLWYPHHLRKAQELLEGHREVDLYACSMTVAFSDRVEPSLRVAYGGHQRLVDFYYGRFCWARRRRSIPPSTWVFRRETCDLPMEVDLAARPDIWWLLCLDGAGRSIRQTQQPGAIFYADPGRQRARNSSEVNVNWALRLEGIKEGCGQHFLIGVLGREYVRSGFNDEWFELLDAIPNDLKTGWDYRTIQAAISLILRRRRSTASTYRLRS